MKTLFLALVATLALGSSVASAQVKGTLAGSCTMQTDGSFNVVQNGSYDNNGNRVNTPYAGWTQSYPISTCPTSGSHMNVKCADGWKPVVQNITQMDCRTSASASLCWTYWITYACAKQ